MERCLHHSSIIRELNTSFHHTNSVVVKAIVSFYRIDSDSAFERFRSRIPINDVNTIHALKKHLVAFLGLEEFARKFGLVDFDTNGTESGWEKRQLRHHHGRPRSSNYQACWMAQETKWTVRIPSAFILYMPGSPEVLLGTATCFEYSRSHFSCNIRWDHNVIDTYLSLRYRYVITAVALCI